MIVVDKNSRNPRYLINESAVSFTENYQGVNQEGNPIYDVVAVSIVSNAAIMVYDENNGIGYGNDLQYQRWRLNGATTGLVSAEAHNIYAHLSRGDKREADIIFSVRNYNTDGSIVQENGEKTEPSDTYYYILIGTLTALTDVNAAPTRTLTFDPGYLSSQKSNNEQGGGWISKMFDIMVDKVESILVKLPFYSIRVLKDAIFEQAATFLAGLKLGSADQGKIVTSVATDLKTSEESEDAIATPAYVKVFSEGRYLRYDIEDEQTVKGPINFESNVSVGGDHDVSGNQSIGGNSTVRGDQTINGELNITKNGTDDDKPAITIGDFIEQGDIIQGARVTKEGMASFAGIKSPTIQVYELIYNRKTAVQGEYVFSDGDTIDKVEYVTLDGTHIDSAEYDGEAYDYVLLTVRAPYEGYVTTFKPGDILYSNVNMIGASGSSAVTGKCWMYALTDNDAVDGVTIKARLYHPSACPAGVNIDPTRHMTISRHGNIVDKSRQNVFIISAEKNNLLMLRGVKSPIVDSDGMYGVVLGELPETLLKYVRETASYVSDKDPYIYARGVIVQDLIVLDYQGVPIRQEIYRGPWSEAVASGAEADRYRSTNTLYHTVTHNGSLWQCMVDLTSVEPARGIAEWTEKVAKGDSSSPLYQLKPSVNVVYYHTQTKQLSVSAIDVVIGVADDSGYYNIADQYTLEQRGLSVYYTIDGVGEPRLLNISPMAEFELEDGTAIIATEDLASLGLEGESINITDATENITL